MCHHGLTDFEWKIIKPLLPNKPRRVLRGKPPPRDALRGPCVIALTVGMDILTNSHQITRIEIVDTGRRRHWSESEKVRIVEESLSAPRRASATAR